jgi:hypothetical protein
MVAGQTVAMRSIRNNSLEMGSESILNRAIPEKVYDYELLIH